MISDRVRDQHHDHNFVIFIIMVAFVDAGKSSFST